MYRAGTVAERLGVAVTTVRSWSTEFQAYLSPSAGKQAGGTGQRRYTDGDLATLGHVKRLLAQGWTFEEARRALEGMTPEQRTTPPAPDVAEPAADTSTALALPGLIAALTEAHRGEVAALRDALAEARARAERAEREADDLRAQLEARPLLPPPAKSEPTETPSTAPDFPSPLPLEATPEPSLPEPQSPPLSPWARIRRLLTGE